MKKYGFGFATVLIISAQGALAGGFDISGFGHHYAGLTAAATSNLSYLENRCRAGRPLLIFRNNLPAAFALGLKDPSGRRLYKLIPVISKLLAA